MFKINITKNDLIQNSIGLGILIIVGLIFWPLAPRPNPAVSGIFLPNTTTLPAPVAPDQVQVLQVLPSQAKILGEINTKLHFNSLSLNEQNQNIVKSINYAKELAGKAGANAIVVTLMGSSQNEGPLDGFVSQASAIQY